MANRPKGYGLSRELGDKIRMKYSEENEAELAAWIQARTGLTMPGEGQDAFCQWLRDGKVLCELINSLKCPGVSCKITDTSHIKMEAMKKARENENISGFLKACEKLGVSKFEMFQTVDLYENQNMAQVQTTLYALGSAAQKSNVEGPLVGQKIADENKREFDDEKLRVGRNVIGLQMGTNQVASQKGMTGYGQGRQIIHKTN